MPWTEVSVESCVSVRLCFWLDDWLVLGSSGGSTLFHPDSNPVSTWADRRRGDAVARRSMSWFSSTCEAALDPSQRRGGDLGDGEASDRGTQSLPSTRCVSQVTEIAVARCD